MTQVVQDKESKTERDEITFADIVGFFRRNWVLLALLTVVLSAVAVTVVLLLPKQYQKDATLAVNLGPSELLATAEGTTLPLPTPEQLGSSAVSYLQGAALPGVEVKPTFDPPTQQIKVVLNSRDAGALEEATPEMVSLLETGLRDRYEGEFDNALEMQIARAERRAETASDALDSAEQRAQEASSEEERLASALLRANLLAELDQAEAEREDLEQSREDLSQLIADTLSVEVLAESAVRQARTPTALVLLAVAGSLAAAVALTFAREVFARHNKGRAKRGA